MACTMNAGAEIDETPAARWDHRPAGEEWTRTTLNAISTKGQGLTRTTPADIDTFCPAYRRASAEDRQAFWMGLFSAIAKHESTWNPAARGAGGRYRGMMQISPATARSYGCNPAALYDATENLTCTVRIASRQVERTGVVVGGPGDWGGVAADWGPLRNAKKRADIASWTRKQDYCTL